MTPAVRVAGDGLSRAMPVPAGRPLSIAMLAPPWIAVPPPGYGGVEWVVSALLTTLLDLRPSSTHVEADLGGGLGHVALRR